MLRLRTLGELRLLGPAGDLLPGRRKELALLAFLARRSPRAVRRAELMALLWGERDEEHARHSLRQALLALRRALGEGLAITSESVTLGSGVVEMDLVAFDAAVTAGRLQDAAERGSGGDFLTGVEEAGGEAFRLWVEAERERARRQLAGVFERLVGEARAQGDRATALAWAERWTELLPFDEAAHLQLIEALYLDGHVGAAKGRHVEFVARLRAELDVEPSAAFARLGARLQEAATAGSSLPAGTGSAALFTPDPVGQEAALAELQAAWATVAEGGAAGVVLVEGGEGMGKTLLCERFLRTLDDRAQPALILQTRAREERDLPWSAARELLAALPGAPGLGGAADRALAELSRLLPVLRERWPQLPKAQGEEGALHQAVAQVLEAVAAELPIVLFLDDLPLADLATRQLLIALAHRPPRGMLLLLSARTEGTAATEIVGELCHAPGIRRLKRAPLAVESIEALLGSMLELPAAERRFLAERLHAETGGNPCYAVEIVSAMVDEGHLAPDALGIWRTRSALGDGPLPLPTGVRDAIVRRFAHTSAAARQLAAAAAVFGGPADPGSLRTVSGVVGDSFDAALEELIARHLLRHSPARAGEWEFAHPLLRRVAYEMLPAAQREALHRTVVAALRASPERSPAVRAALSYHRARAGPPRRRLRPLGRPATMGAAAALLILAGIGAAVAVARWGERPVTLPVLAVGSLDEHPGTFATGDAAAVGDMLATNLARVPGLQVISSARMYELLAQLADSAEQRAATANAARRAGAGELLEGALHRSAGGRLRLDLRRVDLRTGAVRGAYIFDGTDVFALVDRATAELTAAFGLSAGEFRVAEVTTTSLVAYRFYEEGLRSYGAADYQTALRLFEAALAEDSVFAMAELYALGSRHALDQPTPTARLEWLERLAGRTSERERLLIRSTLGAYLNDPAFSAFAETLVVRYPTEPDGHLMLGAARADAGDFLGALPHLRRVIRMDSLGLRHANPRCRACSAFLYMVSAYLHADSARAAERTAREWIRLLPESPTARAALAGALVVQGRHTEATAAFRTSTSARPAIPADAFFPINVRLRSGDFAAADRSLAELVRDGSAELQREALWVQSISLRYQGRQREALETIRRLETMEGASEPRHWFPQILHRAQILAEMRRFQEAASSLDSLAASLPDHFTRASLARRISWTLTHLAAARAAAGDTARLDVLADTIEAWGRRSSYGRDWRLHHHVRGLLLAAREQPEQAVAEFRRAVYSPTHGYTRTNLELAKSLLALDQPREAVAVLQPALRGEIEASNLYLTRTDLHALLGQAWEAAGRPDSAAAHYRWVLAAWRRADPELQARRDSVQTRLRLLGWTP